MAKAKKVVNGTKDRKKFQVIKGQTDTRQLRCTNQKCKNLAIQVPDGKGGFICQCTSCGLKFKFAQL